MRLGGLGLFHCVRRSRLSFQMELTESAPSSLRRFWACGGDGRSRLQKPCTARYLVAITGPLLQHSSPSLLGLAKALEHFILRSRPFCANRNSHIFDGRPHCRTSTPPYLFLGVIVPLYISCWQKLEISLQKKQITKTKTKTESVFSQNPKA